MDYNIIYKTFIMGRFTGKKVSTNIFLHFTPLFLDPVTLQKPNLSRNNCRQESRRKSLCFRKAILKNIWREWVYDNPFLAKNLFYYLSPQSVSPLSRNNVENVVEKIQTFTSNLHKVTECEIDRKLRLNSLLVEQKYFQSIVTSVCKGFIS